MERYQAVAVSGVPGFAVVPNATITVYAQGTTNLSTIYSDNGITTKLNPFNADGSGVFFFYVANGRYDIKISDGTNSRTLSDIVFNDGIVSLGTDAEDIFSIVNSVLSLDVQTANKVFAGPVSGAAVDPTFRLLVAADIDELIALADLTDVTAKTGTGTTVVMDTSPSIVTPIIASFVSAGHSHQNVAGAGQLDHGLALTGLADDDHTQYALRTIMTTLGDLIYAGVAAVWTRLAGNITTTKKFLVQTGTGAASAAPVWDTIADADIPASIARDSELHNAVTLAADADVLLSLATQEIGLDTQTANLVLAGPASGVPADPTFRALVDADIPAAIARDSEVTAEIATHAAAADPHTGYRLESADHTHQSTGLQAGQIDHGLALIGLGDDDHTQYALRTIMTTLGDIVYAGVAAVWTRLAGNTTTTRKFLRQTGDGTASAAPVWDTLVAGDLAAHNILSAQHGDSTVASVVRGDVITGQDVSPTWKRLALGTNGQVLQSNGTDAVWTTPAAGHDAVTLAADADVLLGLNSQQLLLDSQTANLVFAGPASGAAADPTFRALVAADRGGIGQIGRRVLGLVGANNATTPNTKYDLAADEIIAVASGGLAYRKTIFASTTCDFGVVGANGIDAGTQAASTWYQFFFIYNPTTDTWATIASTASPTTGPTLPSGYTAWAFATSIRSNSLTQLTATLVRGKTVSLNAYNEVLTAGSATAETAIDISPVVPPKALMVWGYPIAGNTVVVNFRQVSGVNMWTSVGLGNDTSYLIFANLSQNLYYINNAGGGAAYMRLHGYSIANGDS